MAFTLAELNREQRLRAVRPSATVERFVADPRGRLEAPVWVSRFDDRVLRERAKALDARLDACDRSPA